MNIKTISITEFIEDFDALIKKHGTTLEKYARRGEHDVFYIFVSSKDGSSAGLENIITPVEKPLHSN